MACALSGSGGLGEANLVFSGEEVGLGLHAGLVSSRVFNSHVPLRVTKCGRATFVDV